METLKILQSIHTLSGLNIMWMDENFHLIKSFQSNSFSWVTYDFSKHLRPKLDTNQLDELKFVTGALNESYFIYPIESEYIIFGPFTTTIINDSSLKTVMEINDFQAQHRDILMQQLKLIPLVSLYDLHAVVQHLHYCLTREDKSFFFHSYNERLLDLDLSIEEIKINLDQDDIHDLSDSIRLERDLLKMVSAGDVTGINQLTTKTYRPYFALLNEDTFINEKYYSILLFEKVMQAAISAGVDPIHAHLSRNEMIVEMDQVNSLEHIIKARIDAALFFTKQVSELKANNYSALTNQIIHYIENNLYQPLKVKDIADHFAISESNLRTNFMNETNWKVKDFIIQRKIELAKKLLTSRKSVAEVAKSLGFFDTSHFTKSFKQIVGSTPKRYQIEHK
ncbi:YSIRK-targeted surface antigen transcriptional regulator [Atopobacter phocae]|uniref:YSIRK-targeted surface antigen transcriptional regulator n=1 Tax=Atopobacter phocae TaxID=136492 RepID=UPI00046F2B82|nr:YSIRK-targeted surface antigen transcriptional regulator [Atopobacter phocae]